MKNNSNLTNDLFKSGILESGRPEEINAFKENHRKEYLKSFHAEYKNKTVRKTLIFSNEEFNLLSENAENANIKLSPYLKQLIFSALNETYILPEVETVNRIELLLRDIQNRVTETIMYVHMSESVSTGDIERLKTQIQTLELLMENILKRPPKLKAFLETQVSRDKSFIPKLLRAISDYIILD